MEVILLDTLVIDAVSSFQDGGPNLWCLMSHPNWSTAPSFAPTTAWFCKVETWDGCSRCLWDEILQATHSKIGCFFLVVWYRLLARHNDFPRKNTRCLFEAYISAPYKMKRHPCHLPTCHSSLLFFLHCHHIIMNNLYDIQAHRRTIRVDWTRIHSELAIHEK